MNDQSTALDDGSRHWDQWQALRDPSRQKFTDWGDHPTILALVYKAVFGDSQTGILEHLLQKYPHFSKSHVLSLCSGDGAFERSLLGKEVFGSIVGIDFSATRVDHAQQNRAGLESRLEFRVGDVNEGQFGHQTYDVVFAKAALHHVQNLEALVRGIRTCLRPGGCLVTIDFFGPTRFQWTDSQLKATNHFLSTRIPRHLLQKEDGGFHDLMVRPTLAEMIRLDPSEAVRSGELHELLRSSFQIEEDLPLGGTLLNLIFYGDVINNFQPDNEVHDQIIREAFEYERRLIDSGDIGSDFRLIVARNPPGL